MKFFLTDGFLEMKMFKSRKPEMSEHKLKVCFQQTQIIHSTKLRFLGNDIDIIPAIRANVW